MAELDAVSAKWIGPAMGGISTVSAPGQGGGVSIRYKAGKVGGVFTVQSPFESWAIAETQMRRLKNPSVSVPVPKVSRAGFVMPKIGGGAVAIGSMLDELNRWRIASEDALARSLGLNERALATPDLLNRFREDKELVGGLGFIVSTVAKNLPAFLGAMAMKKKTGKKAAGRVRVHGYSRRSGSTVKDFKRKSPRK